MEEQRTVMALYDDLTTATRVVNRLVSEGFARDKISVVASDASREYERQLRQIDMDVVQNDVSGTATGAGIGAVLGGLGGLLVGLGVIAIPGIGPVLAAGPLVAAIAGAGVGAAAGGLIGALADLGVPEEEAGYYAEGVRRGSVLVITRAYGEMADRAVEIMDEYDPVDLHGRVEDWRERGWTGYEPEDRPLTPDEIEAERSLYSDATGLEGYSDDPEFDGYADRFRRHYEDNYALGPYGYNDYLPAYYYGYHLASQDRYLGSDWYEIEPLARTEWERDYPDSAWDDFKDAVRHAWSEVKQAVS